MGRLGCGYCSVVECDLPKVETRVRFPLPAQGFLCATLAQLAEHHFRKVGVRGSIPRGGSLENIG